MAYNPQNANGQATMSNSTPVVVASDQSALPITDNGGSLTVDGSVSVSGTVTANAGTGTMNVSVQNASIPITDNGGSLTVDGSVSVSNFPATQPISGTVTANAGTGTMNVSVQNASIPVTGTFYQATQPVSAASLPLPTGAATSAKQPALGTAGTASADVITVQGIASMTALKTDGSGVTQPVSGTVTANAGTGSFTVAQATAANLNATVTGTVAATQSGNYTVRNQDGSGNNLASSTTTPAGTEQALIVRNIPSGTQAVSGTITANAGTGTMNVSVQNASIPVTGTFYQATQPISAASLPLPSGAATSAKQPALGTAGTASADVITVQGITSMTPLKVDGSATTQPVSGSISVSNFPATQPVSGTVTANAGTGSFTVAQATAANLNATVTGTVAATQSGSWNVGLNAGSNAIGSITNTSFAATQATAANLNATVVGTGTFAVQADTELPAAASLADATTNPSTTSVGALGLAYNGSTWDRIKTGTAVDGNGAVDFTGAITVKNAIKRVNPSNLGTAINSASTVDVNGANNVTVGIATTTTGTFIIEGTADNTNWFNLECYDIASDLWVSATSITPTAGKAYAILSGGLRQVRIRTNATLGATVSHFYTLDNSQAFLAGIDTGAAPHNFGYTLVHKDVEYTTAQTGTVIWTPTTGKKFAVSDLTISVGGTTSGIVTIFDAVTATTTYTAGTTPAIFRGTFAPSATANPGVIKSFNVPYVSAAANNVVHVTTSAAMTVYIQLNGYEI